MSVPIQIIDDRAILDANPEAKLATFLDHWSMGYIASLGELEGMYVIKKVIYDLNKVDINKVREVAKKVDEGLFECPACQKIAKENPSAGNNGEGVKEEKVSKEKITIKPVSKEKITKEEVKEPELELELDEVEIQELEREKAIQKIVNAMDEILLMKMMR